MKGLTLRHPWPFAICHWGKRIENRSWFPPSSLIGQRFVIHGGKVPASSSHLAEIKDIFDSLKVIHGLPEYRVNGDLTLRDILMPGIVCTAVLDSVIEFGSDDVRCSDPWFDKINGNKGWVLRDVIVLPEPIAISGAQGLWNVPQDVVEEIERLTAQLAPRRTDTSGRDVTDLPGLWDETDNLTDARGSSLGK